MAWSTLKQSKLNGEGMTVGQNVVVIGAGNTAIDCATVARRLGASTVTMVYRRSEREMSAYPHEYDFIRKEGVEFRFLTQPVRVIVEDGRVTGLVRAFATEARVYWNPRGGPEFIIAADQVVKAVGQEKPSLARTLGLAIAPRLYPSERRFRNQHSWRLCRRRLHSIQEHRVHGDGRSGRQARRHSHSRPPRPSGAGP